MKILTPILALTIISSCKPFKLPTTKYSQYSIETSYSCKDNQLEIRLVNPLKCPLRIWIKTSDNDLQTRLNKLNPILLNSESDTIFNFISICKTNSKITFPSLLGNADREIKSIKLELPFPREREYKVIQGNNTNYTHNSDFSRYAVDFDLKTKDTICSSTNGFVVGVVEKYKSGGKGNQWKPYGNFITIYEPNSGIFTQYVHLVENGSFVEVGDKVKSGQAIGLSGMTGQTDIEHLHFNCLVPTHSNKGLISIPFEFIGGYKSTELKKGDLIKK